MISLKKLRFTIGLVICFLALLSFVSSVKARRKNIIGIAAFSNHASIEEGGVYPLQTSITPPVLYFGRSFGMITILGNISYCYWSWQQQQAGEESRGWRISSVTPSMGIKFKLLPIEEEKVFPYIYGEIGKEIILSEEVSSDDEDWAKSGEDWIKEEHDEPHFIAGFGLEIPLNERSSISGELGIIHLKKKYEGEGWLKLEELKEWTSYSKIILNYYF